MERTKYSGLQWRKEGRGSLRIGSRIIKPGQVFTAAAEDIPESFRDVVVCLDKEALEGKEEKVEVTESEYKLQKRPNSAWYDVIGPNGKRMNEKALQRPAALELIKELEG